MKKKNMWILIVALIGCGLFVAKYAYSQKLSNPESEISKKMIIEAFKKNVRKAKEEGELNISKYLREMSPQEIEQEFAPFAASIIKKTIDDLHISTGNKISVKEIIEALPLNVRESLSIERIMIELKYLQTNEE